MPLMIDLQVVATDGQIPEQQKFQLWADAAGVACGVDHRELTIRVTDEKESADLNESYRHKTGSTNVLSFPFEDPPGVDTAILGDLVICAPVVQREAIEQGKTAEAHWAHMLVHGVLHLCGFDHLHEREADEMEMLETDIITGLGYPPPYNDYSK